MFEFRMVLFIVLWFGFSQSGCVAARLSDFTAIYNRPTATLVIYSSANFCAQGVQNYVLTNVRSNTRSRNIARPVSYITCVGTFFAPIRSRSRSQLLLLPTPLLRCCWFACEAIASRLPLDSRAPSSRQDINLFGRIFRSSGANIASFCLAKKAGIVGASAHFWIIADILRIRTSISGILLEVRLCQHTARNG